MALALSNLKRADMPLNKETKPNDWKSNVLELVDRINEWINEWVNEAYFFLSLCAVYNIKLHQMVRLQFRSLGNVEYLFITITRRSTLIWSVSICQSINYESNGTVQSFTKDYYY